MNSSLHPHPLHPTDQLPHTLADSVKYTDLIQHMPQGYCVIDVLFDEQQQPTDYRFLEVNPLFEQLTGLVDAVGKTMRQLQPDHEQHWFDLYGQVAKTGQSVQIEQQAAHPAGGVSYDVLAFPVGATQPHSVGILFTDSDQRKRREQQQAFLLQFSDLLRAQTNPDALATCALQLLLQQLGLDRCYIGVYRLEEDRGEFTHQVGNERVPPVPTSVRLSDFPDALRVAFEGTLVIDDVGKTAGLTDLDRHNLGSLGFGALVATTLRYGERNPLWSIVAISARPRRWTSAEIKLIDEVTERTWTAIERVKAEEARRVADGRKDEFLAMLAHELRNPMSTIRSGLEILTVVDDQPQTTGPSVGHETIALMNRQVDHLVHMVDDLLDVSRISRGKIELKRERLDFRRIVAEAVEAMRLPFDTNQKSLQFSPSPAPLFVQGDPTRLTQVVMNLLTNGLRYTSPRGQVWVSLAEVEGEALLKVSDDGIGLSEHQLTAIFELFVQADNSLARTQGGLGVGLTLARRLVELHGGRLEASSGGLGQGSTFRMYLPLAEPPEKGPTAALPIALASTSSRILVIDDNADAALMLSTLLRLKGHEVHSRLNGREGIQAAESLRPAVIICDIGMPELDGYATCRLIREQSWGQSLLLIALTGYGGEEDKRLAREAGFDRHLVKPVDLATLTGLLSHLLEKRATSSGAD